MLISAAAACSVNALMDLFKLREPRAHVPPGGDSSPLSTRGVLRGPSSSAFPQHPLEEERRWTSESNAPHVTVDKGKGKQTFCDNVPERCSASDGFRSITVSERLHLNL